MTEFAPRLGDALIIVDVQNDFLTGGSLAVADGDAVIAPINRCSALFSAAGHPVFATRDWHPKDHCSFNIRGGSWPPHCVAHSRGADFPAALAMPETVTVISKATEADSDAYSGFEGTGLAQLLRARQARRVFVTGLATDYCVLATVKDALAQGFEAVVVIDAVRAVNATPDDGERALGEMRALGAKLAALKDVVA